MENRTGLTTSLDESLFNKVKEKMDKARLEFARISKIRGTVLCLIDDIKEMDMLKEGDSSLYYDCLRLAAKNALENVEIAVSLKENQFRMLRRDFEREEVSNPCSEKFIPDLEEREKALTKIDDDYVILSYPF